MKFERRIVWLASYPKSGNTWMRAFLYQYCHDNRRSDLNELFDFIPAISDQQIYAEANGGLEPSDKDYANLHEKVLRSILQNRKEDPCVVLKTHNARVLHRKRETVPRELTRKAIYLVRNPLDVVDSLAHHMGLSLDGAVDLMCADRACLGGAGTSRGLEILKTWAQHVMSWSYGDQQYPILIVRYEDILALPELGFRNVISFLGWSVFEDRLKKSIENSKFGRLKALEDEHGFLENPRGEKKGFFRTGRSNKWQDTLCSAHVDKMIETNGEMMRRLGYLDENMEPV